MSQKMIFVNKYKNKKQHHMDNYVIYLITNKINGKIYIGQTKNLKRRITDHFKKKSEKIISTSKLYKAIEKYGKDNFDIKIIDKCTKNDVDEREIYWISYYDSTNSKIGYNITPGGNKGPEHVGCDNKISVLSYECVEFIRKEYEKLSYKKDVYHNACSLFGVINENTFNDVWLGKTYKNIMYGVYTEDNKIKQKKLSLKMRPIKDKGSLKYVMDIRTKKHKGIPVQTVRDEYKNILGVHTVNDIWYDRTYPEIQPEIEESDDNYNKFAKKIKPNPVVQIDKISGNIIAEYDSPISAVIAIKKRRNKSLYNYLRMCCDGKARTCLGYKWKWKKDIR